MSFPRLVFPVTAFALLLGCSTTVETPPAQPRPELPDREAADRVLNTMREKIAAAEELVVIREDTVQRLEAQFTAGRGSSTDVATARVEVWEARIRALNYRQEMHIAEGAMPLIMQTMQDKVAAAEKVLEIREEVGGQAQARVEAGTQTAEELVSIRSRIVEDRIRVLNYRQELYTAEAVFGMAPGMIPGAPPKAGDGK